MKAKYKDQEIVIVDEFVEVGYKSETVKLYDIHGNEVIVGGCDREKNIVVMLSLPHDASEFISEAYNLDVFLSTSNVPIRSYVIFAKKPANLPEFSTLLPLFDSNFEFGTLYGTKIESTYFSNNLTKALFVIGKDGAIYFDFVPRDLDAHIDIEKLRLELNKAFGAYTGMGCH